MFKTLKVAFEGQEVRGPNFVIRFAHGTVQRGGMTLGGAMPGRSFNQTILASEALFRTSADGVFVDFRPVGNYEFKGREDTVENVFYAELILATEATSAQGRISEGQHRLASLKSMIDLRLGTRVLGVPLTEEVGELFDDGHFNRQIHSGALGGELELDPHEILAADLLDAFDAHAAIRDGLGGKARRAFDVACEWYWTSIHEDDPVVAYIGLHVALEAVVGTQNHAARELSRVTGKDETCCRQSLTEHKRHRNALVHGAKGGARDIEKGYLTSMRVVVEALLADRLGVLDEARTKWAAQALETGSPALLDTE